MKKWLYFTCLCLCLCLTACNTTTDKEYENSGQISNETNDKNETAKTDVATQGTEKANADETTETEASEIPEFIEEIAEKMYSGEGAALWRGEYKANLERNCNQFKYCTLVIDRRWHRALYNEDMGLVIVENESDNGNTESITIHYADKSCNIPVIYELGGREMGLLLRDIDADGINELFISDYNDIIPRIQVINLKSMEQVAVKGLASLEEIFKEIYIQNSEKIDENYLGTTVYIMDYEGNEYNIEVRVYCRTENPKGDYNVKVYATNEYANKLYSYDDENDTRLTIEQQIYLTVTDGEKLIWEPIPYTHYMWFNYILEYDKEKTTYTYKDTVQLKYYDFTGEERTINLPVPN